MKRKTIFIIFILIFSILLFTSCGKKKEVERELPELEKTEEPAATEEPGITPEKETVSEEEIQPEVTLKEEKEIQPEVTWKGKKVFELQIVAIRDYSRIEIEQNNLARYGYNTLITTTIKGGETFYRLRLDDLYTYSEAFAVGEKLKEQFSSIHEYWIQKVR